MAPRKKAQPAPEDIASVRSGAYISSVLPHVEEELIHARDTALTKAYHAIEQRTLTPGEAYAVMMELHAYDKIARRLKQKVRMAEAAGRRSQDALERGVKDA